MIQPPEQGRGARRRLVDLPETMLTDYRAHRGKSELGRILATAKRLREAVNRVVIVGNDSDCLAARALFGACCHPYHNEQGRGDRGGRPRIYFTPSGFDNDALQGLLDLLPHGRKAATIDERWGMIVIDAGLLSPFAPRKSALSRSERRQSAMPDASLIDRNAEDAETEEGEGISIVARVLLAALRRACGGDEAETSKLVVPVTGQGRGVAELVGGVDCPEQFEIPNGAGGPAGVFSAAGLLADSVMGLDIVRLLEGGAAMNERFRAAPIGDNPPLDFAGVCRLMRQAGGSGGQRIVAWGSGGEGVARWCEGVRENLDLKFEISNFRLQISDFKSQIPEFRVNLIVESVRRDRIAVEGSNCTGDPREQTACQTIPELLAAAIQRAKAADAAAGRPAVDICLPALDESALGQLFQMMILASATESRRFDIGSEVNDASTCDD